MVLNVSLSHHQQPNLEGSAAGSGGFQAFTWSVQAVAHVDCGQWLHHGLGPIKSSCLGTAVSPGHSLPRDISGQRTVTHGWEVPAAPSHLQIVALPR